ncbi:MAG: hypothetical protein KBD36_02095 [Alphaproteobacteria bacterium]|nr:hypothetical protein [Alphaproteobacteria bacterium]MBP9776624.1 hypothetical protein [Alphaproteobacteria bacterium]
MKKIILLSTILTTLSSTFAFSKVEIDNSISAPYLAFYGSEPQGNSSISGNSTSRSGYTHPPVQNNNASEPGQPQPYYYGSEPH